MKTKWQYIRCCCLVVRLYLTLYNRMECSPPASCPWNSAKILEWVAISTARDLPQPRIKNPPALTGRICTIEPPGKPTDNTTLTKYCCLRGTPLLHVQPHSAEKINHIYTCLFLLLQQKIKFSPLAGPVSPWLWRLHPFLLSQELNSPVICFPSGTKLSVIPSIKNRQQTNSHCL